MRRDIHNLDVLDSGKRRPSFYLFDKLRYFPFAPLHHNFDRRVWAVSYISNQSEPVAHVLHKIAESNPLDSAMHGDLFRAGSHALT